MQNDAERKKKKQNPSEPKPDDLKQKVRECKKDAGIQKNKQKSIRA